MKKLFFLICLFFWFSGKAQLLTDSVPVPADTSLTSRTLSTADTTRPQVIKDSIKPVLNYSFTSDSFLFQKRLFFSFTNPVRYTISEKPWQGKDVIFYSIVVLLIAFALIKNSFRRYLADLFSSYFRTTVRQRQVKEQLLQNPIPSLLFNIFFIISTAVFLSLILQSRIGAKLPFEWLVLYCAAGLTLIYGIKFLVLKFFGWTFQMPEAVNTYIFIVFSTNKILGVVLLPFIILIGFTYGNVVMASITISALLILLLFAYRYFLSYISVNSQVRINFFHFALYLAAFEILPLLLINKLLFRFLSEIY